MEMIGPIETNRLILREWREEDLVNFAAMNANPIVMQYFPSVLTKAESDAFARRIIVEFQSKGYGLFAVEIKDTGNFIGYVGLHQIAFDSDIKGEVEIGWRLDNKYWGKGFAPEAAEAVLSFAAEIGHKKLYSFTAVLNKPSERVMNKIGMSKVGEFEHPALCEGHRLRKHVLYSIDL